MCGIVGALDFAGRPVTEPVLRDMLRVLKHRGPDDEDVYVNGPVGLGHCRLSIIDLSAKGRQPMCNEDATIWLSFNGEIYNFREIRKVLEGKGHGFASRSDSEVVIHAYEEWGIDCLHRFNGMFAFALWDSRNRQLWLARDRLGVKPLFYCASGSNFVFASEIKAILQYPQIQRSVDHQSLDYFLALNYMPAPFTLFKDIFQLLPGHYIKIDSSGKIEETRYWDLHFQEDQKPKADEVYREQFEALFADAVRSRLVSDVPFGSFLSGGLDSSSVSYYMAQYLNRSLKTFSVRFDEPSFNEAGYAQIVADMIKSQHYEISLKEEPSDIFPRLVWHGEEPTADSSMLAFYRLSQFARQEIKMALSGDGADEILAGYETYQAYYLWKIYRAIPSAVRQSVINPLVLSRPASFKKVSLDFKLKQFVQGAQGSWEDAHARWRLIFHPELRSRIILPDTGNGDSDAVLNLYREMFSRCKAKNPLNRMLYVDTCFYLPNDMLVKVDRMSMAHGLEVRTPFLDYRLVEFMATVPPSLKLRNLRHKKYLLKLTMKNKLPRRIINRPKKGFNIPNAIWFRNKWREYVLDLLSPESISKLEFLDAGIVGDIVKAHMSGQEDNSHKIWGLLSLVIWWNLFIGSERGRGL
ncbi:MAG: asparagine synthase (glutamine-hydrolyzing) [Syntrophomonadaceae bacterium]|nr:asparagine synthase (glutamine-hydrolyzing) [Syntrophomonadaceae bacterium]